MNNKLKITKINYDGVLASLREKTSCVLARNEFTSSKKLKSMIISGQQNCVLASLREKRKENQLRHSEKRVYEFKEVKKSVIISVISGQKNCVLASLREKMSTEL